MENIKVDVIIPAYHPGKEFATLIKRLEKQSVPIHRIIVMNTEETYWNKELEEKFSILEVHHLKKQEFDHGATRACAAELSDADVMVFMTQDALPADKSLIENLVKALTEDEKTGAAYARQLPMPDCHVIECYTRSFNYPDTSSVKSAKDLPKLGIKTFFCSDVCALYRRSSYEQLGGFVRHAIFNEDMIFASKVIRNFGAVGYCARAKVIHSHNYSGRQQFHRNFDLGVSQAEHPEVFASVRSENEGIKMVKQSAAYFWKQGKGYLIPKLIWQSGCKYLGYRLGKKYQKLPMWLVKRCTMSPGYWEHEE